MKTQVQNTNTSSITSKLSACQKGFFCDEFLKYFVNKPRKRSSIINRGYHVRAVAVECAVKSILKSVQQVIILGAGFDTLYFRWKKEGFWQPNIRMFEVDYRPVMAAKLEIICRNEVLNTILGERCAANSSQVVLSTPDYILLSADLSDLKSVRSSLNEANCLFSLPTLFVSECVLNYLTTDSADRLVQWIPSTFPNCSFLLYDQVQPRDGFGLVMCKHFEDIGTPLGSIQQYPSPVDQLNRFYKLGWKEVYAKNMDYFSETLGTLEAQRLDNLEEFDEFEELDLVCKHYCLLTAFCGSLVTRIGSSVDLPSSIGNIFVDVAVQQNSIKRFAHGSAQLDNYTVALTGGFGINENGQHQRLEGITLINLQDFTSTTVPFSDPYNLLGGRMFHKMAKIDDQRLVLFGGRGSPSAPFDKTMLFLDKCQNSWTVQVAQERGQKPTKRWRHSIAVTNKLCFVHGGKDAQNSALSDCYLFDVASATWIKQEEHIPARHSHASVLWGDNKIVVTGGHNNRALNLIETFNIENNTWDILDIKPQLETRYSHCYL